MLRAYRSFVGLRCTKVDGDLKHQLRRKPFILAEHSDLKDLDALQRRLFRERLITNPKMELGHELESGRSKLEASSGQCKKAMGQTDGLGSNRNCRPS